MSVKRLASIVAALLVTAPIVSGLATAAPDTASKEVVVVNDATKPVPTAAQGTTQVAGSVSIDGTPNVIVANDTPIPVDVGGEGSELRIESSVIFIPGGQDNGSSIIEVPEGKRFVVEYFTAQGHDFDPGVEERIAMLGLQSGGGTGTPKVNVPVERNAPEWYAASEPVQFFDDGNFFVSVSLDQPASGAGQIEWRVEWTISGYMVDAP